ncbi:ABC transporter permease [Silvimonas amylolytica]|uniref:ABC transporter permease n=1 Tax=Silvimonas amylolytica TaxID=449663 RepID=A0ABQ2PN14_9NEIS|nr:FtsX-like permease family protein [Silvimonas amylolytica]GGP26801.1 ABC transporter permease [Silvimonas amylolytica]
MIWRLTWRRFRRGLIAGDYRTLLAALIVTVAALTAVGILTGRMGSLLNAQANTLLAADAVLSADHPVPARYEQSATAAHLTATHTAGFPSMVSSNGKTRLAAIKAVNSGYPLRGTVTLQAGAGVRQTHGIPAPGEVWIDPRLAVLLGLKVGSTLDLGLSQFKVAALLDKEPDAALDFSSTQPRLTMNAADLPATGLLGFGSRVRYRLLVAGAPQDVTQWKATTRPQLQRGERLEDVRSARPEVKVTLERAEDFLRLVTLLAAALASAAVLLAARRHALRQTDAVALFVAIGASRRRIASMLWAELLILWLLAALIGGAIGWSAQAMLAWLVRNSLPAPLPPGDLWHWLIAAGLGGILLLGTAGPALLQLARTPPVRVLRHDSSAPASVWATWLLAGLCAIALMFWLGGRLKLTLIVLGAMGGALVASALLGWACLTLLGRFSRGFAARIALRQLIRRRWLSMAQMAALAMGLLGVWLLTVVEHDLLASWQSKIPERAPNQFAINIQPAQAIAFGHTLQAGGVTDAPLQPMIRGRWTAQNGQPVKVDVYKEDRARQLAEREFNLSWGDTLRDDNRLVAGVPLRESEPGFSVESGIAETLHIKVGDELTFDVAGTPITARVLNLRKVDWDSFRVNFFVTGTRALFRNLPASLITSFYLPPDNTALVPQLVSAYPNVTVIDVGEVLAEVRRVLGLATSALSLVFVFCLVAALVVLVAALETTAPERQREVAILRALGAQRHHIAAIQRWEGLAIGAVAGLVAGLGASVAGWALGKEVLDLPVHFNGWLPLVSVASGVLLASAVTAWERRRLSRVTALALLRDPA